MGADWAGFGGDIGGSGRHWRGFGGSGDWAWGLGRLAGYGIAGPAGLLRDESKIEPVCRQGQRGGCQRLGESSEAVSDGTVCYNHNGVILVGLRR